MFEDFRLVRNYLFWRLKTTRDKARKRLKTNQDIKKTILEAFQTGDVMIIWISRTMLIYFLFWTYREFVNRYIVGLIYPIFVLLNRAKKFWWHSCSLLFFKISLKEYHSQYIYIHLWISPTCISNLYEYYQLYSYLLHCHITLAFTSIRYQKVTLRLINFRQLSSVREAHIVVFR